MALDLMGVAHVFEITQPETEYLTETIGRPWSAFNGSVRTYYPGLVFDEINYYSHPLITRHSISLRNAVESDDPDLCLHEIEDYVKNYVLSQRVNWEENGIKFYLAEYQDHLLEQRKLNAQTQKEQQDLIDSFEMQIKQLEEQRDENAALAESYASDCEELKAGLGQRSQLVNKLKARIASLEYLVSQSGQESPSIPTDGEYTDMEAWVNQYFPDKLVLHPRAIRSLKGAVYEDKELVYKCLILLATAYYQYQTGYIDYDKFMVACKEVDSSLDERGAITDSAAGMQGDSYFVQYHGKRRKMERHLAKGSNKDRRYCLRIYYFGDDEEQAVVICDMPHHLDTSAT